MKSLEQKDIQRDIIGLVRNFLRFFFKFYFFFFLIQEHNYQSRMYAPLLSMTCCQRSGRERIPLS